MVSKTASAIGVEVFGNRFGEAKLQVEEVPIALDFSVIAARAVHRSCYVAGAGFSRAFAIARRSCQVIRL